MSKKSAVIMPGTREILERMGEQIRLARLRRKLASELGHAKAEEGTLLLAPEHAQDIELQDVSFAYQEGNPVLRGITAEFEAGKCYARAKMTD